MAYTKEIREKVLNDIKSGIPIGKISRIYQISVPTIYNWKNKYLNADSFHQVEESTLQRIDETVRKPIQESTTMSVEEAIQRIVFLRKGELFEEALSICNYPLYKDNREVLFQKVNVLFKIAVRDNDIEKAKEAYDICENPELAKDKGCRFLSVLYSIINQFPTLKLEKFPILKLNIEEIVAMPILQVIQEVQKLRLARCLEDALNICNHWSDQNNMHIIKEKAITLFHLGRRNMDMEMIKESFILCRQTQLGYMMEKIENEFKEVDWSQYLSQVDTTDIVNLESLKMMPVAEVCKELKTLMSKKGLEEVLKIIDELPAKDNPMVASLKVKALYLLGKRDQDIEQIKKAYENCLRFQNNPLFQEYIEKIKNEFQEIDWSQFEIEEKISKSSITPQTIVKENPQIIIKKDSQNEIIRELIAKIYCDFINAPEIETANMDTWYKDLLMLALFHKMSRERAISFGKELKVEYQEDEQKVKTINQLLERIKMKKGVNFDINEYVAYLPASFDFSLAEKFSKEKALLDQKVEGAKVWVQNLQVSTLIVEKATVSRKPEKRMIVVEGKPVTARYQQIYSSAQVPVKVDSTSSQSAKELKIKDIFGTEMFEIGKLLYVEMQKPRNVKRGLRAWDTLENLKEKSTTDEWALRSALSLINRIGVKTNQERNDKIYQELEERRNKRIKEQEERVKKYTFNN